MQVHLLSSVGGNVQSEKQIWVLLHVVVELLTLICEIVFEGFFVNLVCVVAFLVILNFTFLIALVKMLLRILFVVFLG